MKAVYFVLLLALGAPQASVAAKCSLSEAQRSLSSVSYVGPITKEVRGKAIDFSRFVFQNNSKSKVKFAAFDGDEPLAIHPHSTYLETNTPAGWRHEDPTLDSYPPAILKAVRPGDSFSFLIESRKDQATEFRLTLSDQRNCEYKSQPFRFEVGKKAAN
ncbi:hypothetical protein [Lysobacter firmicutimachus]|uniref:Uncharacterized protein n=1 Tax=Lysobacter firmicutimachus TaxID=1792846 RepID=A0ABU8CYN7_9GAMM